MKQQQKSRWHGTRWLITGGSSGLGKWLARRVASEGGRVVAVARGEARLREALDGVEAHPLVADISSKDDIYRIVGEATSLMGGVDVLVNNASALGPTPMRLLLDTDCEDLSAVVETNLLGPFRLTKAVLPSMVLQGEGLVVNISSDAAQSAYPTWGSYSTSKAALDHLTRIWQEELRDEGIRFVAVDPGDMNTPMHLAAIPDADPESLYQPDDVARDLLAFLAESPTEGQVRLGAEEWRSR